MKFIHYLDEFGNKQFFNPELVTCTQAHHFQPKDENNQVPDEHLGCLVALGQHGFCISIEKSEVLISRIEEALNGAG